VQVEAVKAAEVENMDVVSMEVIWEDMENMEAPGAVRVMEDEAVATGAR